MNEFRTRLLDGVKILEIGGIGPNPFCGMLLADLGADVLRITSIGGDEWPNPVANRGKRLLPLNLKDRASNDACLRLAAAADVLIEGFRPGVMEKLGLGPDVACQTNIRLIYGRMTGWGQTGPLAQMAGHDINYIALTGILAAMGSPGSAPRPPLNLIGDFGGGALYLAMAVCAALFWRQISGRGQIIDAAIVDGASSLLASHCGFLFDKRLSIDRDTGVLNGTAPHYGTYLCSDGLYIAVGAIEPKFYDLLLRTLGLDAAIFGSRDDPSTWLESRSRLAAVFVTRTRADWCELFKEVDVCFAPVLSLEEATVHAHMEHRQVYVQHNGVRQPAPAPRFSETPLFLNSAPEHVADLVAALAAWGIA